MTERQPNRVELRILIKVGCCGYPTSMKKYYERFGLVELNQTFYGK